MQPADTMREALKVAREGMGQGELPIGAVLVLNGEIIARAHTAEKTLGGLLVHAELRTLLQVDGLKPFPGKRRDTMLFTTLEPCLMCLGAAMSFMVGTVYYALESPGDGAAQLVDHWQRDPAAMPSYHLPDIQGGLLREESKALFAEYAQQQPSSAMSAWAKTLAALP
jgi:tRNA(adenine34) deaminase